MISKISLNENRATHFVSKALLLFNNDRFVEALESCESAYDADSNRVDLLLLLSTLHFKLKNYDESAFYSRQCLETDPNSAEAYNNLGNATRALGDNSNVNQYFLKATKLKPQCGDAYNNLGTLYLESGNIKDAIKTFQMAILLNPSLAEAHANLGHAYQLNSDFESAKTSFLDAIKAKPAYALAWNNLATLYKELNQYQTAIAYYKESIRHNGNVAEVYNNLGNVYKDSKLFNDAIETYETALKLRPKFPTALCNLASCYYEQGNLFQSILICKRALRQSPDFADAHNNLGNALRRAGRLEESVESFRTCLTLCPDHHQAYSNLGVTLCEMGLTLEGMHCYVTAIRLCPTFAAAHSNLGHIFTQHNRPQQAVSHFLEALRSDTLLTNAYVNLAFTYILLRNPVDAIKCCQSALKIDPNLSEAHLAMGAAHRLLHQYTDAIKCFNNIVTLKPDHHSALIELLCVQATVCDWTDRHDNLEAAKLKVDSQFPVAQQSQYICKRKRGHLSTIHPSQALILSLNSEQQLRVSHNYSHNVKCAVLLDERLLIHRPRETGSRLKIGYLLSSHTNENALDSHIESITLLLTSILSLHNRRIFDVTSYLIGLNSLLTSSRQSLIEAAVANSERCRNLVCQTIGDIAEQISRDGINILVDLEGFFGDGIIEVMSLRPAPIQASLFGFPGLSGSDFVDYMIYDSYSLAPARLNFEMSKTGEKLVRLPSRLISHTSARAVTSSSRSNAQVVDTANSDTSLRGQRDAISMVDQFIFCNFGSAIAIHPSIMLVWMRLLHRVPNSVLMLLRNSSMMEQNLRQHMRCLCSEMGWNIDEKRLIFAPLVDREKHLQRVELTNLYLDSPDINSFRAISESLVLGVPVLSMEGDTIATRAGASALQACKLSELISSNLTEYEEIAVRAATDNVWYANLQTRLNEAKQASIAFDAPSWVRLLERGFNSMWDDHINGCECNTTNVSCANGSRPGDIDIYE